MLLTVVYREACLQRLSWSSRVIENINTISSLMNHLSRTGVNITVLFAILNNYFASSQLVRPLTVLTFDDEQLDARMIFFETIELIARQKKLLNVDDELERLRRQIASLLTKEQWQSIVGHPKLTQKKFYPLLGMSIATAYNGKEKSDAK